MNKMREVKERIERKKTQKDNQSEVKKTLPFSDETIENWKRIGFFTAFGFGIKYLADNI